MNFVAHLFYHRFKHWLMASFLYCSLYKVKSYAEKKQRTHIKMKKEDLDLDSFTGSDRDISKKT